MKQLFSIIVLGLGVSISIHAADASSLTFANKVNVYSQPQSRPLQATVLNHNDGSTADGGDGEDFIVDENHDRIDDSYSAKDRYAVIPDHPQARYRPDPCVVEAQKEFEACKGADNVWEQCSTTTDASEFKQCILDICLPGKIIKLKACAEMQAVKNMKP